MGSWSPVSFVAPGITKRPNDDRGVGPLFVLCKGALTKWDERPKVRTLVEKKWSVGFTVSMVASSAVLSAVSPSFTRSTLSGADSVGGNVAISMVIDHVDGMDVVDASIASCWCADVSE